MYVDQNRRFWAAAHHLNSKDNSKNDLHSAQSYISPDIGILVSYIDNYI